MHRPQQKPHTRGNNPLNTSPPSMKRPPLHRHTSSPSPSPSSANKPPTPKKGSSAIKPQRPPVHHRRTASAHYITHHPRNKSQQSLGKLLGAGSGPASYSVKPEVEHLEMATSFLQYCAMCEKQITVPSNSVLYCSESCRRKDSYKPLSASSYTYTMTSSPSSPINIDQPTTSSIIMPTSSPTSRPIPVSRPLARIPSDLHEFKSDLDPTEWKPIISGRHGRNGSSTSLASSDAWNYLSQFHHHHHRGGDETGRISSSTPPSSSLQAMMMPFRRTPTTRNSTSSLSTMGGGSTTTTPSLVNTPRTTTASSSVTGSPPSSSSVSDYIGAAVPSYGGYTYTPPDLAGAAAMMDPSRPLPPRHNPSFSTSGAGATKGVELVVPHIIASAEDEDVHEGIWMRA